MKNRLPCGWIWKLEYCKTKKCNECPMNKSNIKSKGGDKYEKGDCSTR